MSLATDSPPASALRRGGDGVERAWRTLADALPTPAWVAIWLGALIAYGAFGKSFDGELYGASIETLAFVMMALGLNVVVGFAGLLDLGYVAFYAFGMFFVGWFASGHFDGTTISFAVEQRKTLSGEAPVGIHVNVLLLVFGAAAFTAVWGAILGAPTLRLRGDYLAIVTLAFGEIVPRVLELSQSGPFGLGSLDLSNGRQGITPVDKPYLPGVLEDLSVSDVTPFFFVALAMCAIVLFVNCMLRDSRLGRAWIAVREDEVAASAMGVPLVRVKLWAYAIGAAIGGFSGAFLGSYKNTVNVDQFEFQFSIFILAMVILGGMGNIAGVVVGAVALSLINQFALPELNSVPDTFGLDFDVTAITGGIFGFLLLTMMVLRPQGILPNRRRRRELTEEVTDNQSLAEVRK